MVSKKLIVSITTAVCIIINDLLGSPVSLDAIYSAIGIVVSYLLGQGLSDIGKGKAVEELKSKILEHVQQNNQPSWEDTCAEDKEDATQVRHTGEE